RSRGVRRGSSRGPGPAARSAARPAGPTAPAAPPPRRRSPPAPSGRGATGAAGAGALASPGLGARRARAITVASATSADGARPPRRAAADRPLVGATTGTKVPRPTDRVDELDADRRGGTGTPMTTTATSPDNNATPDVDGRRGEARGEPGADGAAAADPGLRPVRRFWWWLAGITAAALEIGRA